MLDHSVIIGQKIFVLTAHPDDESYLASGTIYKNNAAGGETYLACATMGEKGMSHLEEPMDEAQLAEIRHDELKKTCDVLNVGHVHDFHFPDGSVSDHVAELSEKSSELIAKLGPDIIMSFGSDGITGHNDHIAVSEVAAALAKKHGLPLVTFCIPKEIADDAYIWLKEKRVTKGHYVEDFTLEKENICIPIDAEIKMKALKCYDSQIDQKDPFAGWPEHLARTLLEKECFCYNEATE